MSKDSKVYSDEQDNIYYDVTIANIQNNIFNNYEDQPVEFLERRTQSILTNPRDYYMSIAKFSINGGSIPLYVFPIQSGQTQNNVNLGIESITLKYMASESQQYLIYMSTDNKPVPVPPSNNPPSYNQVLSEYYYLYEYQEYVNIINNALLTAFNTISKPPLIPGDPLEAPFMIYNIEEQKFSIIVKRAYYENTLPDNQRIDIYFNYPLISNFQGFNVNYNTTKLNGKDVQIVNYYTRNNLWNEPNNIITLPALYIENKQQYKAITTINSFDRIAITSNCLPINNEFLALKNSNGNNIILPIITEFSPLLQESGEFKGVFVYTPSGYGNYRLIDLKSSEPIKLINLKLYWIDKKGNFYPLFQPYGSTCNIKIVFLKKDLYKKSLT